jgi:YcaO-like protein with predicted kinase domain
MRYAYPETGTVSKAYTLGTHRVVEPEETLSRVAPLMPAMGITRIANITGLDEIGIPVALASRPNARSLSVSQGKGLSLAAAKASALMESVEFWHAEHIRQPVVLMSYAELARSDHVVDVSRLPRLSVSTFDAHDRLLWIEGFDLVQQTEKWVPYECVHTDYRLPLPAGSGCFAVNSNGLASGNHILEAITHGLAEVIERDASSLLHAGGGAARRRFRLDPGSVTDTSVRGLLGQIEQAGVLVAIWRTTSDVGVPAYVCEMVDNEANKHRSLGPSAGMGCHPSDGVALCRAVTEAAQSRLTRIASSRDDIPRLDYEITRNDNVLAGVRSEYADSPTPLRYEAVSDGMHADFSSDIESMVERLVAVGIEEVVVVDLTIGGIDLPVVRVVVPGLEPPCEAMGYVPGPRALAAAGTV